jgi:simple sugar transport system substrate-binding protein
MSWPCWLRLAPSTRGVRWNDAVPARYFILLCIGLAACEGQSGADRPDVGDFPTRIVVVTHGQSSDPFWSVVANGVDDAAETLGIRVEYQAPGSFDMVRMSQLIDAAVASRPSGLIVSLADADALGPSVRAAVAAGIPTLSINSGDESWSELGLLAHVGQTEYEAGKAAGARLVDAGATRIICVNHEIGNVSLDLRCRGLGDALKQAGAMMQILAVTLADPDDATQRIRGTLARDPAIDGALALGPAGAVPLLAALRETGRLGKVAAGTFDLSPGVLGAVRDGGLLFAVDQQPYLQGYLGVILMAKYLDTRAIPGGGGIIRTGPAFVTRETAAEVIALTEKGVR